MFRILVVFGTRPEAIKLVPLIGQLRKYQEWETLICVTSQHRQMLQQVLDVFQLTPEFDLGVMADNQSLTEVTTRVLVGMEQVLEQVKPDLLLVHGDTTTTFAVSLAAAYRKITIGHVEAGMRTHEKYLPYPEELNRRIVGSLADLHFAPTKQEAMNLVQEGVTEPSIFITGNTAIDVLQLTVQKDYRHALLTQIKGKKMILVTAHRRENLGEPMMQMFRAIRRLIEVHDDVAVVFPIHLNPAVRKLASSTLNNHPRILLVEPLNVIDFHNFAARAYLILTDSGGIQEEAPTLQVPVLIMRSLTERPEVVTVGAAELVGTEEELIFRETSQLLVDEQAYQAMRGKRNPYGDGRASSRIVQAIRYYFGLTDQSPDSFS